MDLGNVYATQVTKKSIGGGLYGNSSVSMNTFQIEKDPLFEKLENQVFDKFKEIEKTENYIEPETMHSNIKTYNFEDAIKELALLKTKSF
jgi:hypothetical protein